MIKQYLLLLLTLLINLNAIKIKKNNDNTQLTKKDDSVTDLTTH